MAWHGPAYTFPYPRRGCASFRRERLLTALVAIRAASDAVLGTFSAPRDWGKFRERTPKRPRVLWGLFCAGRGLTRGEVARHYLLPDLQPHAGHGAAPLCCTNRYESAILLALNLRVQGGSNGSLAKTTADVAVQFLRCLVGRHVSSAGSTLVYFTTRLHLGLDSTATGDHCGPLARERNQAS